MRPRLPELGQFERYIREIDYARVYSNFGPLVRRLELKYAEKLGVLDPFRIVLCSNATQAIQGFMQISTIPTWHVPSFTFPATVHAAVQSGKEVILDDIDVQTWMIAADVIVDPSSEGLVPVLPFGAPFDSTSYLHLEHVLVDAAASIGSASTWIDTMRSSWAAVFSLHATKSFGIGEGGLIVFGSKEAADKFRPWINFGFHGTRDALSIGTNAKLSEIQAAVGLAVMDSWDDEAADWAQLRTRADAISQDFDLGQFAVIPKGVISPYWIISSSNQNSIPRIESALFESKIATRRWWSKGCHLMPAFSLIEKWGSPSPVAPNTEVLGNRYLGLPFFRGMTDNEFGKIQTILSGCFSESS
jgi:dTDP-4-amino-4,6-dideoxygalactose transaminase